MEEVLRDQRREEFERSIRDVGKNIGLLYKFLNTIRKASKESQDLRAANGFKIKDFEGNDLEAVLEERYSGNILDHFPGISEVLRRRLASAMILRRKRVLYRRSRYAAIEGVGVPSTLHRQPRLEISTTSIQLGDAGSARPEKSASVAKSSLSVAKSRTHTATTITVEKFQKASTQSVVSFSNSVALANHEDLPFPAAPRTKVKIELKDSGGDSIMDMQEVICPYCFHALSGLELSDERKWRFVSALMD